MTLDAHDLEAQTSDEPQAEPTIDVGMPVRETFETPAPTPSVWTRLRRQIMPSAAERTEVYLQRLAILDETVVRYPQSPSGYVMRGELHLSAGMIDPALRDFRQGLALAERQLYTEQWGIIAQVMRDRAREGLEQALRLK